MKFILLWGIVQDVWIICLYALVHYEIVQNFLDLWWATPLNLPLSTSSSPYPSTSISSSTSSSSYSLFYTSLLSYPIHLGFKAKTVSASNSTKIRVSLDFGFSNIMNTRAKILKNNPPAANPQTVSSLNLNIHHGTYIRW